MEPYKPKTKHMNITNILFPIHWKNLLIYMIIILSTLVIGYLYWIAHQEKLLQIDYLIYQEITHINKLDKSKLLPEIDNFLNKDHHIYGTLSALHIANILVNDHKLDQSILHLQNGMKYIKNPDLLAIIKMRIARLQIEQNNIKEALNILSSIKGNTWAASVANIKGDAFLKKGDKNNANKEWLKAISLSKMNLLTQMLTIKINNLSIN